MVLPFATVSAEKTDKTEGNLAPATKGVMATYLLHFARLTTFPESKPVLLNKDGKAEFRILLVGEDPFGKLVDNVFEGEMVGGRPVAVRRVADSVTPLPDCHMVFLGKMESERQKDLLQELRGKPVLCLGEGAGFLDSGMVGFREEGGKVVFDVHQERILEVGMRLDSRLLRIARVVRRAH